MTHEADSETERNPKLPDTDRDQLRSALALLGPAQSVLWDHMVEAGDPDTILATVKQQDQQTLEGKRRVGWVSVGVGKSPDLLAKSYTDVERRQPEFASSLERQRTVIAEVLHQMIDIHGPDAFWLYDVCMALRDDDKGRANAVERLIKQRPLRNSRVVRASQIRTGSYHFNNRTRIVTHVTVPLAEREYVSPVDTPRAASVSVADDEAVYMYIRNQRFESIDPVLEEGITVTQMVAAIHAAIESGIRTAPQAD